MVLNRAVWIAPIALLLIALAPLPYDYYRFLRIAVCVAAAVLIWGEVRDRKTINGWSVGLALLAIVFNPVIPLRLDRETWMVLDIGAAAVLGAHLFARSRSA